MSSEKPDLFDTAKFYDYEPDNEVLSYLCEDEAFEQAIENHCEGPDAAGDAAIAFLRNVVKSITIYAFDPMPGLADRSIAEGLADHLEECLMEDFCNEDCDPVYDRKLVMAALLDAIPKFGKADVWNCHQVAKRTYEGDALVAKAREVFPDWFNDENS